MASSKTGGSKGSASASNALPPPKHVTSSALQQAKESALALKKRMLSVKANSGQYVVKMSTGDSAHTSKARTLTKDEVESLRQTKHEVAAHVSREISTCKK